MDFLKLLMIGAYAVRLYCSGPKPCPQCGKKDVFDGHTCRNCGYSKDHEEDMGGASEKHLRPTADAPSSTQGSEIGRSETDARCPQCGFTYAFDGRVCGHCGYPKKRIEYPVSAAKRDSGDKSRSDDHSVSDVPAIAGTDDRSNPASEGPEGLSKLICSLSYDAGRVLVVTYEHDLHEPRLIRTREIKVPDIGGIYAWYFDQLLEAYDQEAYSIDSWKLLYVGIAGHSATSGGKLGDRIRRRHLGERANASTLRFSLGYLLREELGLKPCAPSGKTDSWWFGQAGESKLNDWMDAHARVVWMAVRNPSYIEKQIISRAGKYFPLNIDGNTENEFARGLSKRRSAWRRKYLSE